jgi:hypothetical protein
MSIAGYTCPIPGADAATVAWHTTIHFGLTAIILVAGIVFLSLALVTYWRSAPSRGR